ncbi:hypothetical protein Y032_0041g469 [Ancylostoma ceylanicum]|uniref:Uncharacterized protein n=2 Tax=Ancylostoma ceylanicum TaxID=53326 RepID=A0A016UI55_9BILA|nr:hypothetical protein Y032_0041g469 [Ancylostoma ceylanicum]
MLNMLHFSNGRRQPHRQSVFDLDKCAFESNSCSHKESAISLDSSLGSLPSSSSLVSSHEITSYNSRCLRNLKRSGIRITPEDVYQLRRELQADYAAQRTTADRKRCLREACATLLELRTELLEEPKRDDESMAFFVFEYQAFLCWIYTTIRFAGFTSEMERHFRDMKENHRILLSALPPRGEPFLLAVLRFSQMCIEYAAMCDDEALQWCRLAYARKESPEAPDHNGIRDSVENCRITCFGGLIFVELMGGAKAALRVSPPCSLFLVSHEAQFLPFHRVDDETLTGVRNF